MDATPQAHTVSHTDGAKKVDTPAGGAKKGEGSKPLAEQLADAEKQNRSLAKQLDAAQRALHERDKTLAERQKRWDLLEQQLADEQEKRRQLTRSNAARLLHVAKLERELEAQKQLQQATQQELNVREAAMLRQSVGPCSGSVANATGLTPSSSGLLNSSRASTVSNRGSIKF